MSLADLLQAPTDAPPLRPARAVPAHAVIRGYAAVFYVPGDPTTAAVYDDGVEGRFMPGAFDAALKQPGLVAVLNHDFRHYLGRPLDGTCRLSVDAKGLRYEIDPPDSLTGRQVMRMIRSGVVTGSSVKYVATEFIDRTEKGRPVRDIYAARVIDVGPTDSPRSRACGCWVRDPGSGTADPDADRQIDEVADFLAVLANQERYDQ